MLKQVIPDRRKIKLDIESFEIRKIKPLKMNGKKMSLDFF